MSALPDRSIYTYRSGATGLFRDNGQPEQTLLGAQYMGGHGSAGDVVVSNNWLFAGTGLAAGARIPNLSYKEVDVVATNYPVPAGVTVMSHSPLRRYQNQPATGRFHDIVFHVKPSGARVFSAGTQGLELSRLLHERQIHGVRLRLDTMIGRGSIAGCRSLESALVPWPGSRPASRCTPPLGAGVS